MHESPYSFLSGNYGQVLEPTYEATTDPKLRTNEIVVTIDLTREYGNRTQSTLAYTEIACMTVAYVIEVEKSLERSVRLPAPRLGRRNDPGVAKMGVGTQQHGTGRQVGGRAVQRGYGRHIGSILETRINNQQKFVFPGSKQFFYKDLYKDPMFSHACDLLVPLEYQQKGLVKE
ncbi:hypothetical protein GGR52DRAFT_166158 [Hypoxylon sp. FL1284]|nr:hypothetical protein GGR52DRAFT_166158 [Hypoxylon sp. FL1284]